MLRRYYCTMAELPAKRPKNHPYVLVETLWYLDKKAEHCDLCRNYFWSIHWAARIVVAQRDSSGLGSKWGTKSIQQVIQHLSWFKTYFDTIAGTFSEAGMMFTQGLMSKTWSFTDTRQSQSALVSLACCRTTFEDDARVVSRFLRFPKISTVNCAFFYDTFLYTHIQSSIQQGVCLNLSRL